MLPNNMPSMRLSYDTTILRVNTGIEHSQVNFQSDGFNLNVWIMLRMRTKYFFINVNAGISYQKKLVQKPEDSEDDQHLNG